MRSTLEEEEELEEWNTEKTAGRGGGREEGNGPGVCSQDVRLAHEQVEVEQHKESVVYIYSVESYFEQLAW